MDFSDNEEEEHDYRHTAATEHITYDDLRGYHHEFPSPHHRRHEEPMNISPEPSAPQADQN